MICYRDKDKCGKGVEAFFKNRNLNPNVQMKNYLYTPLHLAVKKYRYDIVSYLIDNPRIDPNIQDLNKHTPLHISMQNCRFYDRDSVKNFKLLISSKKVDLTITDEKVFFFVFSLLTLFRILCLYSICCVIIICQQNMFRYLNVLQKGRI